MQVFAKVAIAEVANLLDHEHNQQVNLLSIVRRFRPLSLGIFGIFAKIRGFHEDAEDSP
jgi:hypothetical protein